MKLKWEPIWECDDDDENHTAWSAEINHTTYGKYVWITLAEMAMLLRYSQKMIT